MGYSISTVISISILILILVLTLIHIVMALSCQCHRPTPPISAPGSRNSARVHSMHYSPDILC